MSDRIRISDWPMEEATRASASAAELAKSITKRCAQIAAKLLAEQRLDVRLIIHHKNENTHL
jgi:hypothetical protein